MRMPCCVYSTGENLVCGKGKGARRIFETGGKGREHQILLDTPPESYPHPTHKTKEFNVCLGGGQDGTVTPPCPTLFPILGAVDAAHHGSAKPVDQGWVSGRTAKSRRKGRIGLDGRKDEERKGCVGSRT